jgi:chromosome segregation ATPase
MASLESHENMDYEDAAATGKECAETIQGVAEEYRESAEAIEEGFGHSTYQSDELNEKADEIEDYANTIQEAAEEIDSCFDTYSDADSTRDDAHDAHITATKELDEYRGEKDTTEYKSLAEAKSDKEDELDMAEQELDETGEALEEALESLQRAIAECPV